MLAFETGMALLILFMSALWDDPPRWLLRSPLGRWLRRCARWVAGR